MIKFQSRYDNNAYRVSEYPLSNTVKSVEEGQLVTVKNGEVVLATSKDKCAFVCMGSKRQGRDLVGGRICKQITFLVGKSMLFTNCFDASKTYKDTEMTPLKCNDKSMYEPASGPSDNVIAYAVGGVKDGYLRVITLL